MRRKASMLRRASAGALALALSTNCACAFEFRNLFGGWSAKSPAPSGEPPASAGSLDCPEILVESGTSTLRAPPDAESSAVRYQLGLGFFARECSVKDGRILIKVGVEGAAILGPAGQPGAYFADLRVAVRRQKDNVILDSKSYRVGAVVPAGASRAEFQLVADPLSVPYVNQHAADDYEVLVGFERGEAEKSERPEKKRERRRG